MLKTIYSKSITYTIFIILLIVNTLSYSQNVKTKIRGKIIDSETKEVLPFVHVQFKGTAIGTITDFNGDYFIETRTPGDSIEVTYMGYKRMVFKVLKNQFQTIDVMLKPDKFELVEAVVESGENPANILLRKIIANKERNSPYSLNHYQYEVYNKVEMDVNNIDDEFKKKKVFKQFQFVFDYMDTSAVDGKSYLPVFISESMSDYYYQKDPRRIKEVIKATNISGVDNTSIAQYTGQMYLETNLYENFLVVFNKSFVSPVADFGLMTYKYFLIDSATIDGQWCYHLTFKPRRKQELTFTGDMWIHDSTFAIKKIHCSMADDANINFVNAALFDQEFELIDDSIWFLKKSEMFVDFNIKETGYGIYGRNTTSYKNIKMDLPKPENFFNKNIPKEIVIQDKADEKDTSYWNNARHEQLSNREEKIYGMVDSIKQVPLFHSFVEIVTLFVSGYYVKGNFEFGPYYTFYSSNAIEGSRIRLGGRTSNQFSTRVMYYGHGAYGFKDQKFKYQLGAMYMFEKRPRESAGLYYKEDIEQLGQSQNAFMTDNILSTMLQRRPKTKLSIVKKLEGYYEKEWFEGFSNTITFTRSQIYATDYIPFEKDNIKLSKLTATEMRFNTHLAYNEKFIGGEFERISIGSEYPIFDIDITAAIPKLLGSTQEYYKLQLTMRHYIDINPLGRLNYTLETGKIWGNVDYPFLRLHEGNETWAFDPYAFNMMNYYEFGSDTWVSLYTEHHFQGLFLNKIPLLRKLKWREVMYAKGVYGTLSPENTAGPGTAGRIIFPTELHGLQDKPYYEAGVGIENIFKVIRVDALWRLAYLDHTDIEKWGVRASLQIIF